MYLKVLSFLHAHTLLEHANICIFFQEKSHIYTINQCRNKESGSLLMSRLGQRYAFFNVIQTPHKYLSTFSFCHCVMKLSK